MQGQYSAIIRAFECNSLLEEAISLLRKQTLPPLEIVVVDSSGDKETTEKFLKIADKVAAYPEEDFNFSKAINIGVMESSSDHVLIISSHCHITDINMIEDGFRVFEKEDAAFIFWTPAENDVFKCRIIDRKNYKLKYGLSNSCSFIKKKFLQERPFLENVFSAEDKEWNNWFSKKYDLKSIMINHTSLSYKNENYNLQKIINEELALSYYVRKRYLIPVNSSLRFFRYILASIRGRKERAKFHKTIAYETLLCLFREPVRKSKYF